MSFEPKTDWKDGDKVPAADFNRIEQGIADAQSVAWADVTGKPTTYPPAVGTTATTAKAGNYVPTWAEVTGKPAVIAAGADAAAARAAIGAGTSNLAIGNTASTAKAGNWTPAIGDIPTGTTAATVALGNHTHTATQITATAVTGGTATNVQGILAELTARIIALETPPEG